MFEGILKKSGRVGNKISSAGGFFSRIRGISDLEQFSDLHLVVFLLLWAIPFYLLDLGALEFFRHTEADRTLIAWEMVSRNEYIVPHLLGSVILTKPPLFYWLIASAINFFGNAQEWIVRLPSALAAIAFVITQYGALRFAGARKTVAVLGSLFLGTGFFFFAELASVAEIDMVYGLLSAWALYGIYFEIVKESLVSTVLAYLSLGLAFLVKGPPSVVFFGVSTVLFFCYYIWFLREEDRDRKIRPVVLCCLWSNLFGLMVFIALVSTWLFTLANRVGWKSLKYQLKIEVLDRALASSTHHHGPLFYIWNSAAGLLPWSIFLLACFLNCFLKERRKTVATAEKWAGVFVDQRGYQQFVVFNILVVLVTLFFLSLAEGKSSRYFFPAYAFAMNLSLLSAYAIRNTSVEKILWFVGRWFSMICGLIFLIAPFVMHHFAEVPQQRIFLVSFLFLFILIILESACRKKSSRYAVIALLFLMCAVRFGEKTVFIPYRNVQKSVRPLAEAIDTMLAPKKPLYTIEMFERWVVYYLKRRGREVFRMTKALASTSNVSNQKVYLLLNDEEERWRVKQLKLLDTAVKVIREFGKGGDRLLLVEVDGKALMGLEPLHEIFPTIPTPAPSKFTVADT